jgi:hypothetical protein
VVVKPQAKLELTLAGVDAESQVRDALVQEAFFLSAVSNENFRHLEHCSEEKFGSKVAKILFSASGGTADELLQLALPRKIVGAPRFNAIIEQYHSKSDKKTVMKLQQMTIEQNQKMLN